MRHAIRVAALLSATVGLGACSSDNGASGAGAQDTAALG
jgi:hypothetical protein